jgi:hypothetical protein
MREINMWDTLLAFCAAVLSALFLWLAFSRSVHSYWGRRGVDMPFTLFQQRLGGGAGSAIFLIVSVTLTAKTLWPGSMREVTWDHLSRFLMAISVATIWLLGLLDPRTTAHARESRAANVVFRIIWVMVFIPIAIASVYFWLLVKG